MKTKTEMLTIRLSAIEKETLRKIAKRQKCTRHALIVSIVRSAIEQAQAA